MFKKSLNPNQIDELNDFIKQRSDSRELKRALVVKLSGENYLYEEIQKIVGVSLGFITKWKQAFLSSGIKALRLGYQGGIPFLNPEQKSTVINWLKSKNHWNLRELQSYIKINFQIEFKAKRSYYNLFKEAGISWKKSQKKNPKKDPELVAKKKKEITRLILNWEKEISLGKLSVFMIDECHLLWDNLCGYVWGKTDERVEIPMTNQRSKQTYYGALDYGTKEFLVKPYKKADSQHTVEFVKYLQKRRPNQRLALIWDGASYHQYDKMKEYLEEINAGLTQDKWQVTCVLFAPHAPEQNPVEDIWLVAKKAIRENYFLCESFKDVKKVFVEAIEGKTFDFPKVYLYG